MDLVLSLLFFPDVTVVLFSDQILLDEGAADLSAYVGIVPVSWTCTPL